MSLRRLARVGIAVAASFAALRSTDARACMPAPPPNHFVRVADEAALITYDEATKTEHFVRRASFETDTTDFGFVVPVPSRPTLSEADPSVFQRLEELTRPPIVYSHRISGVDPTPLLLMTFAMRSAVVSAPAPVTVLDQLTVAGYDAAILEATSPSALSEWLSSHGYASSPETAEWVAPYVEKKWLFVALRIAPKGPAPAPSAPRRVGSGLVDIAFRTEAPFYPYREPASARAGTAGTTRSLAVYYIGGERVKGTLGASATWAGATTFAKRLDADFSGAPTPTKGRVLTAFVDRASPRPGTDEVYFHRADTSADLVPPPMEIVIGDKVPVPIDVVLVVGGGLALVARTIRKRRDRGR
jgi:hypothetical protein